MSTNKGLLPGSPVSVHAATCVNMLATCGEIDTRLTQPGSRPVRVQRKRTKGWRMPANTVCVCRPGPFGNPFKAEAALEAGYCDGPKMAVYGFRQWLAGDPDFKRADIDPGRDFILANVGSLQGKNLACWCALEQTLPRRRAARICQPERPAMSERTESMVEELRKIYRLKGDTYSSAEVLGAVNRAANEIERLQDVEKAARRYFDGYVQDEAEERECCISDDQHADAKTLRAALGGQS